MRAFRFFTGTVKVLMKSLPCQFRVLSPRNISVYDSMEQDKKVVYKFPDKIGQLVRLG